MWPALRTLAVLLVSCCLVACNGDDPFAVEPGQLRVALVMGGLDLDPDGADITVDASLRVGIAAGGAVTLDLASGPHTIVLGGLAANCAADGGATRTLTVRSGSWTDVAFSVTCGAASGVLEVFVATTGADPDPDGYLVNIDNGLPQRVVTGAATRFAPIFGGAHAVHVADIAGNCAVTGANPVTGVVVSTGGPVRDTVRVAVTIHCTGLFGDLRLITTTTGTPNPAGYVITLNGSGTSTSYRLADNDTLLVTHLPVAVYDVAIGDLGSCTRVGTIPAAVTIAGEATAVAQFDLSCVPPAVLRVLAPTTGPDPDPGYMVLVDGMAGTPLIANDTVSLPLSPGGHLVALTDVAPNCAVSGPNPQGVSLTTSAPSDVVFPVTCAAGSNRTGLDITIATTGIDPDWSYRLTVCTAESWDCFAPSYSRGIPATFTLQLDLAPSLYYVWLDDVAANCQVSWTGSSTVIAGQVATVHLDVTCVPLLEFEATITTTGSDRQTQYALTVDNQFATWLASDTPTRVGSYEGVHAIGLTGLQPNCHATGPNPATVTLVAGQLTSVQFAVDCVPYPILNIGVHTTGAGSPSGFVVGIDWDVVDGFYWYETQVTANGSVAIRLGVGAHDVWLTQVPSNCAVQAPNPLAVNLAYGSTTDVGFTVTCQ